MAILNEADGTVLQKKTNGKEHESYFASFNGDNILTFHYEGFFQLLHKDTLAFVKAGTINNDV